MGPHEIVAQMEGLLVEERAAIARLDGVRVTAIAAEKKRLATDLEAAPRADLEGLRPRLKNLARALQNNGVLLAQAHGILSDLLKGHAVTMRSSNGTVGSMRAVAAAARHLSVRG